MATNEFMVDLRSPARLVFWLGRSGRRYGLLGENLDSFAMHDGELHVMTKGTQVLWVGSQGDLVADPGSRARFRLALDCATQVFRLAASETDAGVVWDLEGAVPAPLTGPVAQAA